MERLDVDGLFWLVDKPDDKVAGRLRFDPVQGAKLGLIGTRSRTSFHQVLIHRSV